MDHSTNALGQAIGLPVAGWQTRPRPPRTTMRGHWCEVEPLDLDRHAQSLFEANLLDRDARNWTYLGSERPADLAAYREWLQRTGGGDDPMFHAIVDRASGNATGIASYLRIEPAHGVIEVGHINFSPLLQRSRAATDAMYLMMRRAFDELGYRRYEWKCDALNAPSRRAAERLGFTYEGTFRQAVVYKGRNRDSAWYSILDREWPRLRAAFEQWLEPSNFDAGGRQRARLEAFRER